MLCLPSVLSESKRAGTLKVDSESRQVSGNLRAATPHVDEPDATAKSVGYKHDTTKVDKERCDVSTDTRARRRQHRVQRRTGGLAQTEGARLRFLNVLDESLAARISGFVNMTDLLTSMREFGERSIEESAALARKKGLRADTSLLPSRWSTCLGRDSGRGAKMAR